MIAQYKRGQRVRLLTSGGYSPYAVYHPGAYGTVHETAAFDRLVLVVVDNSVHGPLNFVCGEEVEPVVDDDVTQGGEVEPVVDDDVTQGGVESTGGPTGYYDFPAGANTLNDVIEYKQMPFAQGNIFKATMRLGEKAGATREYDLRKIIYYANRMLAEETGTPYGERDHTVQEAIK